MGLFDALAPYRDKDGLYHSKTVGPDGGPSTGNGLFTTSIAYILAKDIEESVVYLLAINRCEIEPGLYRRSIRQTDQGARDDYMAVSAANSVLGNEIRHHGERHRYVYNNVIPGTIWKPKDGSKRKWWLRPFDLVAPKGLVLNEGAVLWHHIDFIPHLKFASMRHMEPPGWFGRLLWCLSLWNVARSDGRSNNNAYLLAWLRVYAYKKFFFKYRLCDMAVRYFWKRMDEQGLTMKKVWTAYANDGGEHPFSRYWEDIR